MINKSLVPGIAVVIAMLTASLLHVSLQNIDRGKAIAALEKENAAWRRTVGMKLMKVRGWDISVEESTVTPEKAVFALNPCISAPAGQRDWSDECRTISQSAYSYGQKDPAFKIVLAER